MKDQENKYKETFATWNKVAKLYQEKFMDLDLYNNGYDTFCKLVEKQNAKVLEIGCGPGNITKYLLNKRPDFQIEGLDVSLAMIDLAKQNNPSASFKVFDCRNLDQIHSSFDAIVCGFCIPYLSHSDCSKLIMDVQNLLNDSGILYLSFVEGDYKQSGYQSGSTGDKTYFYYHNLEKLRADFEKNKFELLSKEIKAYTSSKNINEEHIIVILEKTSITR